MGRNKLVNAARMANFAFSFGMTTVVALLIGFWGGSWLDKKFATAPIFMVIGLLIGVAITFQALFSELKVYSKFEELTDDDENNEGQD